VLDASGVELRLELAFNPPPPEHPRAQRGPHTIHLDSSKPYQTVGGLASGADIEVENLANSELIAVFYTLADPSIWNVLALQHGSVVVNGKAVLADCLRLDDELSLGHFHYRFSTDGSCLRPAAVVEGVNLATRNVTFSIKTANGQKTIVNEVTLNIPAGRLTAIIGQSGSGKSTLVRILIGALVAKSGELFFAGRAYAPSAYHRRIAGLVAFVPQDDIVHQELTVQQTLDYAASIRLPRHTTPSEKEARVNRILQDLDLANHRDKAVNALSGGQRKRVNVGVELLASPNILFLDEPTTGLDTGTEDQILDCLRRLALQGRTVVFITHSIRAVDQADHLVFLRDDGCGGRVVAQGPREILKQEHHISDWASLFLAPIVEPAPSTTGNAPRASPLSKLASRAPSFLSLLLRYISIWATTPVTSSLILFLLPAALGALIRIAVPRDGPSGYDRILFGVICAFWLGMNQTVREIVKERTIMLREQFAGANTASYLFSKVAFFFFIAFFQAGLLAAPMLWLRVSGTSVVPASSDMFCPSFTFWLVLWGGLCVGTSLGLLLSTLCLFLRAKGEILAVLLVILVTLPQILFSSKVLSSLVEKAADYHSFILVDHDRKLAEVASYFTATRYLYLPLEAIQKHYTGEVGLIFLFNGTILAAFGLSCIVLTWLSLELFIHHQRTRTHW
jgi:ABC-type multidrug transport system ATPase subunit